MESSLWFLLFSMMAICHTLITETVTLPPVTTDSAETTEPLQTTELPVTTGPPTTTTKTVEIPDLFYTFGPDHGDAELPTRLDDSEYVPISVTLPFFANNYSQLYVSYFNTTIYF